MHDYFEHISKRFGIVFGSMSYCPNIDQTGTFRRFCSGPIFLPEIS
jgi:hypothetical protein